MSLPEHGKILDVATPFCKVLPWIVGLISKRSAYESLPDSVLEFSDQETFKKMMENAGFTQVVCRELTFGIATVHVGVKP